jgi:tetratricopeptide (TPR) repeat protein
MIPTTPVSRRRLWLMRLFAMVFIPLLVLGGIELGLRLGGYGYDTGFFRRIQINGHNFYVPNEKFSYRFFPPAIARTAPLFRFAAEKATNSHRIFLFGESAANGDPDPTYGVGRYLAILLRERYPGTDFQVIGVALTAIDSNVILPIARDCAQHQGDLWLIYMGNNEMVGPFGAETSYGLRAPSLGVIRTILAIKNTRIGELFDAFIRRLSSSTPKEWVGMKMFLNGRIGYDDPARLRAYANFKGNLEDILRTAQRAGVPVILSTVAVNLKDCAPFASIHAVGLDKNQESAWNKIYEEGVDLETAGSYGEALALYRKAAEIDPQFADLQFRMGRCDLALTNDDQARRDFELARDYDALDFRADTRINSAIKEAASRHAGQGVFLLDAASALAQSSPDGIPGLELFYEHVHLNFAGNYLLALNFAEQAKKLFPNPITAHDKGNWASAELCDRRLAVTVWDRQRIWQRVFNLITLPPFTGQFNHAAYCKLWEAKLDEAKSQMNFQTPEQTRQMYEQALALAPDDCFLHGNFERFLQRYEQALTLAPDDRFLHGNSEGFLEAGGYLAQAIAEAKRFCELVPQIPGGYYYVGKLLVREGKISEAADYFSRAIAIQNDYAEAQDAMGEILANQQKTAEAIHWFKRAIRSNPDYADTYLNLGFLQQNQGEIDAAMASYQKAASLEPEGPADYFNRANTAAALYRWDEVIACLRAVVKAKPDFWQARYQLGIQLAAKGETEEAQTQFSETIRYRPDFIQAHFYLGTALATQGKPDQALAEFRTVLQLDPANSSAQQQIETIETTLHHNP